jgi:hypothetical protein
VPDNPITTGHLRNVAFLDASTGIAVGDYGAIISPGVDNPLPVRMTSLVAFTSGSSVVLTWGTDLQSDTYGFAVERSLGQTAAWEQIGFVEAYSTAKGGTYRFEDHSAAAGSWLYRLILVDQDGSREVYGPIVVIIGAPAEFALGPSYPNPFNGVANFELSVPQLGRVEISLYDITGKEVAILMDEEKPPGQYKVRWNSGTSPSGVYFVRMRAGDFSGTRKIMLVK